MRMSGMGVSGLGVVAIFQFLLLLGTIVTTNIRLRLSPQITGRIAGQRPNGFGGSKSQSIEQVVHGAGIFDGGTVGVVKKRKRELFSIRKRHRLSLI